MSVTPIAPSPIIAPIDQAVGEKLQHHARPACQRPRCRDRARAIDGIARDQVGARCPRARSGPSTRITARSASASAALAFCSTIRMVTPASPDLARAWRTPARRSFGDRPADGSSSISTRGCDHQRAGDREHLALAARQPPAVSRRWRARSGNKPYMAVDLRGAARPSAGCRRRAADCRRSTSA